MLIILVTWGMISIHAPRTGSDIDLMDKRFKVAFQSTLPARGATMAAYIERKIYCISIHAPRTGSDYFWKMAMSIWLISIHAPRTGSDKLCRGHTEP